MELLTPQSNRARWPWVADIVDDLREVFGPEVKVAQIREGGVTVAGGPMPLHPYYLPDADAVKSWDAFVAGFEKLYGKVEKHQAKFATYCETHYVLHCQNWRG